MKKSFLKSAFSVFLALAVVAPTASFADSTPDTKNIAYAEFSGKTPVQSNLTAVMASGDVKTATYEGRTGWILGNKDAGEAASTINVDLSNYFAYKVSDGSVFEIDVDYYDAGGAVFSVVYSAQDRPNRWAGMQKTSFGAKAARNSTIKAWRTKTFRIQDAKFANDLSDVDFKISSNILNENHDLDKVTTDYGTKYSTYYLNRYPRVSSPDEIVIGAVRVRKLEEKNPLSGKITTSAYGNVFYDNEAATYDVALTNNTDKSYELNARYYAVDTESGLIVDEKKDTLIIGASESKTVTAVLDDLPYGVFKLYAEYTAEGIKSQFVTDTSRARESKTANPRAGTNIHFDGAQNYPSPIDAQMSLVRRSGYSSVRDSVRWAQNEPVKGQYKFNLPTGDAIEGAKRWGLDFFATYSSVNMTNFYPNSAPINDEEAWQAYKDYCHWIAHQLGNCGYAVESDNEWNLQYPNGTGEQYTYMLKAIYEGTKAANPDMKVIGVDMGLVDIDVIRSYAEAGALEYMDGLSFHPYDWMRSFEAGNQMLQVARVKELLKEFGHEDKEIWCTETGWHQQLDNCFVTDMDKANNLSRALLQNDALKWYDRIYFYEFMNSGIEPSYGEATYGTIYSAYDETPCAALPAYIAAACANWVVGDGNNFVDAADGKGADLTAGVYAYRWNRENDDNLGNQVIGVWTSKDREPYALDLGVDEVTALDIYGNARTMKAVNGVFNFMLTDSPMYLIGDFKKFVSAEPTVKIDEIISVATVNDTVVANITIPNSDKMTIVSKNADFEVVQNAGFKNGTAKYVVSTPALRFYNKNAMFDVMEGDKLIYAGSIKVNNDKTVTISENHGMSDTNSLNRWYIDLNVTNNKNSGPISGTLKIKAPSELTKYVGDIKIENLAPKATYRQRFFLPEIVTKEMRSYDVDLTLDNGEYFSDGHTLFFTTVPYAYDKPTIDGKVSHGEYRNDTWFPISPGENSENVQILEANTVYLGDDDLSGKATATYDEENLYFFIEVTDNQFVQNNTGSNIWDGDSIQIGLADEDASSSGSYNELTVALTREGPQMWRHLSNNAALPTGPVTDCELAIVHEGTKTYYEIKIPWAQCLLKPENVKAGYAPKFAFLINDDDGVGRNIYMEYSQILGAIGTYKNIGYFSDMYLADK